jgi:tryptophan synthase alpha chain
MTLAKALEMTAAIRQTTAIPIILFSYYNPILAYGLERFYRDGLKVGADGLLVVDLPPEESPEMTDTWPGDELALIRLVAPTTPQARMQTIAEGASGFLYLVSKTGVTGSAGLDTGAIAGHARNLRALTHLPICVGFGISTPEDVAAVARVADGVVIGSAFERLIEENLHDPDLPARVGRKAAQYKAATITPDK